MRPSLTRYGDQEPKFWIRPDLHLRGVHVDPVVREARTPPARPGRRSGSRGSAGRPRRPAPPAAAGGCIACTSSEIGIDEITWSAASVRCPPAPSTVTTDRPPTRAGSRCTAVTQLHGRPCRPARGPARRSAPTSSRARTSGTGTPRSGWSSSVLVALRAAARCGSPMASDRFLIRCAAQSACSSVRRHTPHLLGVGLEEVRVQPPAEPGRRPSPRSVAGPSAAAAAPRRTSRRSGRPPTGPRLRSAFTALSG